MRQLSACWPSRNVGRVLLRLHFDSNALVPDKRRVKQPMLMKKARESDLKLEENQERRRWRQGAAG
jgi:hypothetical protein